MPNRIAIAIFPDVEELDFAGPWEVLRVWQLTSNEEVEVFLVADTLEPITCAKGLRVLADHTWETCPSFDVLVYPGGKGTRRQLDDGIVLERMRDLASTGVLMTSVCTGSLVFAAAGMLTGKPATTHWGSLDKLRELAPTAEVRETDRFVDSAGVITASGVSAGIDMALHLVKRLESEERAREVRRYIQYDPAPPV